MKQALLVVLGALVVALGLPSGLRAEDVVKELTDIQRQWEQGEIKKDRATYDRVCADDYVQGTRTGLVLSKEQWLELITKPGGGVTKYHTDNMQVRVLGMGLSHSRPSRSHSMDKTTTASHGTRRFEVSGFLRSSREAGRPC